MGIVVFLGLVGSSAYSPLLRCEHITCQSISVDVRSVRSSSLYYLGCPENRARFQGRKLLSIGLQFPRNTVAKVFGPAVHAGSRSFCVCLQSFYLPKLETSIAAGRGR